MRSDWFRARRCGTADCWEFKHVGIVAANSLKLRHLLPSFQSLFCLTWAKNSRLLPVFSVLFAVCQKENWALKYVLLFYYFMADFMSFTPCTIDLKLLYINIFFLCLKDKEMEEACTVMNNLMKIQIHLLDCLLFLKDCTSGIAGAKWQWLPFTHTTDLLVVLGSRQPPQALLSIVLLHVSCYWVGSVLGVFAWETLNIDGPLAITGSRAVSGSPQCFVVVGATHRPAYHFPSHVGRSWCQWGFILSLAGP